MNLSIDQLREIWYRIYIEKTIDVITVIDKGREYYGIFLSSDAFIELLPRDNMNDYILWKSMDNTDVDYKTRTETIQEFRFFTRFSSSTPTSTNKAINVTPAYFYIPSADKYFKILPNDESDIDVCRVSWSDIMQEESVDLNKPFSVFGDPCVFIRTFLEKYENDFFEIGFSNGKVDFCENKLPEVMCAVEDTVDTKTEYLTIKVSLKP